MIDKPILKLPANQIEFDEACLSFIPKLEILRKFSFEEIKSYVIEPDKPLILDSGTNKCSLVSLSCNVKGVVGECWMPVLVSLPECFYCR